MIQTQKSTIKPKLVLKRKPVEPIRVPLPRHPVRVTPVVVVSSTAWKPRKVAGPV